MPYVCMISLGCAKNTVDAEMILAAALDDGFDLALDPSHADVVLVNTCGFIEPARQESRDVIEEMLTLKKRRKNLKLAVMGCFSERAPDELAAAYPGIDALWGLDILPRLGDALRRLAGTRALDRDGFGKPARPLEGPRLISTPQSYAYLKISDGCDNRCAYCAIPDIRGPFRSRPPAAIVEEARVLEQQGARELVVISQDTTLYGRDLDRPDATIADLMEALLKTVSVPRLRLLYAHPAHLEDRLIGLLQSEPRLCGYLDIPFQHVSDRVLARMGRGYGRDRVEELLGRFAGGGVTVRTTIMTGFPGETEEDFLLALDLAKSGRIHHMGVFAYSPEEGTPAAAFADAVPAEEAERRRDAIMLAQRESAFAWLDSRIGGREEVLIDAKAGNGVLVGRTRREAPDADGVVYLDMRGAAPGDVVDACIDGREDYDLLAGAPDWEKPHRRKRTRKR